MFWGRNEKSRLPGRGRQEAKVHTRKRGTGRRPAWTGSGAAGKRGGWEEWYPDTPKHRAEDKAQSLKCPLLLLDPCTQNSPGSRRVISEHLLSAWEQGRLFRAGKEGQSVVTEALWPMCVTSGSHQKECCLLVMCVLGHEEGHIQTSDF